MRYYKMTANYGVVKGYSEELVRVGSYPPLLALTVKISAYCEEPPGHISRPSRASNAEEQGCMGQHHCKLLGERQQKKPLFAEELGARSEGLEPATF